MDILRSDELQFKLRSSTGRWDPDFHLHNFCEIYLLLEGEAEVYVGSSRYYIYPGALLLFNDRELHKAHFLTEGIYKRCFIHIPPALLSHYSTSSTDLSACFYNRGLGMRNLLQLEPEQIGFFMQLFDGMSDAQATKPLGFDLLIHSYLIQLLVMTNSLFAAHAFPSHLTDRYPQIIRDIIAYIDEHLLEELTLEGLAQAFSLNKYYLCHIFKKETGATIFRFILLKRVSLSRVLLAEGKNVTEACFLSGFRNYANFITTFRKCSGCTPKKYKDMLELE